ncbi:MAG: GntR family transcriptional regulator [Lachnospiraceae bacterium]|nr:GntR family transcriptional regulator [Lachnospiraceae bacterium]
MNIKVLTKSGVPIYEQITEQIKNEIVSGNLKQGEPLPSIRSLAADLKISVITTKRAYEELEKEGLIYSVAGKGFYVDNPDMSYLEEKRTLGLEDELTKWIDSAKEAGLAKEDVISMISIIWGE